MSNGARKIHVDRLDRYAYFCLITKIQIDRQTNLEYDRDRNIYICMYRNPAQPVVVMHTFVQ